MTLQPPYRYGYDYGLGIDSTIISYIRESVEIDSRISPVPCYLLQRSPSGSLVGSSASPFVVATYSETSPNYRTVIWPSGSVSHPDLRPYTNGGEGSITVLIGGTPATRVLDPADLAADNEFAVIERLDLDNKQVELVFNTGFNAAAATIQYYYTTMNAGVDPELLKRGDTTDVSLFGWTQYLNACTDCFRTANQILVRQPLTTRDLVVNEEGRVTLEENECWMIWTPYIKDFDVLVVAAGDSVTGEEERYEIVNKKDSVIQRTLISQRFKVKLLEPSDARYSIPYSTT